MNDFVVAPASIVTEADVRMARLGTRFGRLDLSSQLALLAVESLRIDFEVIDRDRVGICLAARAGSLSTDVEYWSTRNGAGGPSPTLFTYTLPSAAIGEIAIRHRLTGPNLCWIGDASVLQIEAEDMIRRNEADVCICVHCDVVTQAVAEMVGGAPTAKASAFCLKRAES